MSEGGCDPIERLSLHPDAVVADRYRLVDRIGAGGMGSVWRATHVTLAHDVAIKFLQVTDVTPAARARFEREAKIAARLGEASRHITRVIDYGMFRESVPYLVMEHLQGETLSARVRREGRLSLEVASRLIVQLCRALQVAHAAGVIHRDIKPSNVFLVQSDIDEEVCVKLMDFGIAKSTIDGDGEEMTSAGTVIGTPQYMSPEQILSKRLDARTDLWGVAACLYRIVCGRTPFGQGGIAELGLRILATDPLPPSTIERGLPSALDTFMEKALAKSAEERFQSARDFADALSLISGIRGPELSVVTTIVPLPDDAEVSIVLRPSSAELTAPSAQHTRRDRPIGPPPKRSPNVRSLATIFGALALAAFFAHQRGRETKAQAAEVPPSAQPRSPVSQLAASTSALPASTAPVSGSSSASATVTPPEPKKAPPAPLAAKAAKPAKTGTSAEGARLWSKRDEL